MYRYNVFPRPLNHRIAELSEHRFWLHGHYQNVDIEGCTTGSGELEARASKVDRFKMKWTHAALGSVTWWVILNSSNVNFPPDFIFHEENFRPSMNKLPSLANWKVESSNALVKVIEELMAALQMYELKQIPESIQREFETVLSSPDVDRRFCSVNVLAGSDLAEFWSGRQSLLRTQLSQPLQTTVGPVRCTGDESSLERAMKSLHKELSEYLRAEKRSIGLRRDFLRDVITLQGDSLTEVDMELFRSIELLLNYENVFVLIHIQLPPRFLAGCNDIVIQAKDSYGKYEEIRRDFTATENSLGIVNSLVETSEEMAKSIAMRYL